MADLPLRVHRIQHALPYDGGGTSMVRAVFLFAFATTLYTVLPTQAAGDIALPRLSSLENRLAIDAADGQLNSLTLFQAALVAGGISSDQDLANWSLKFDRLVEQYELENPVSTKESIPNRAVALHRFIHHNLLFGKYNADRNELNKTLVDGDYNCVTATLLFQCFAERLQLPVSVVATSTHVLCRLDIDEPHIVEMTTENSLAAVRPLASVHSIPQLRDVLDSEKSRTMTPSRFVAKIYYNRAVAQLSRSNFPQSIVWLQTARSIDESDPTSQQNLLAAINNWALAECDRQNFDRAAKLLEMGKKIGPAYSAFADNDIHIHQQWALHLCKSERFADALDLLERGFERRPDAPLFAAGRAVVWQSWAQTLTRHGKSSQALEVVDRALRQFPQSAELKKIRVGLTLDNS